MVIMIDIVERLRQGAGHIPEEYGISHMKHPWHEAQWMAYYKEMRRFNQGTRPHKPRAPLQYGHHIDSLPREQCWANGQIHFPVALIYPTGERAPGVEPLGRGPASRPG
jgi:hypothetical protein